MKKKTPAGDAAGALPVLSKPHHAFVLALFEDPKRDLARAYAKAYGKKLTKANKESCRVGAMRVQKRSDVAAVWESMTAEVDRKAEEEARAAQSEGRDIAVLTVLEKRQFLAQVVRTPVRGISEDSPLIQEWFEHVSEKGATIKVKMCGKLEAIKLDSELAGDFPTDKRAKEAVDSLLDLMISVRGGGAVIPSQKKGG